MSNLFELFLFYQNKNASRESRSESEKIEKTCASNEQIASFLTKTIKFKINLMKKITAIALLSIAIISCKKETQTVTKVDPKTGKTITVEVPVEEKETAKVENPAIKDSLGVYYSTFKLEKGKTYPFTTYQRDTQTMSNGSKSMTGTNESTDEMTFTVNSIDEKGNYDITMNLVGKRLSASSQGKTQSIDTKGSAPTEPQQKFMWEIQKAQVGNGLKMKMDKTGKITSISGFEPVYQKISKAATATIKDAAQTKNFMDSFKQSFNEKSLKEQFGKNISIFPVKGAKIGQSWTETENVTPDGSIKISTTYTLTKVENGIAEIAVKGGIPRKAKSESKNGMSHSVSLEGNQNGTIRIDANTGWILGSNLKLNTTEKESLSDGKQSQTLSKTSNSLVSINPSYKF